MWSGRIKAEQVHVARVAQRPRPGGAVTSSGVAGVVRGVSAPEGRSRSAGRNDPRVVEASTLDRPTEDRARDELYEKLHSELQRPARAMVRRAFGAKFSDAEIEDIYANAWVGTLRALRNRPGLSEPELRKYVLTAVANHASKELRRRGRRPTSPLDSAPEVVDRQATPDERVAIREQAQITREILATLPERRRAVLMFRYAWGLKPEEVCGLVDGLSHRAYRNDTVEQVRAPAGPTEMVYKVEASSSIVGAAQEPFAIASAQPLTPLANPEVDPVNSREDASGTVNCQTDVVVSTELENESPDLDANSAGVTLNLPAGVSLVSGPASQPVSGGVLERSTPSSETHTWTVRATSSGAKQLTITGSGGTMGETFTSSDQVAFEADCSPPTVTAMRDRPGDLNHAAKQLRNGCPVGAGRTRAARGDSADLQPRRPTSFGRSARARDDVGTALMDGPSDPAQPLGDRFRLGKRWEPDIRLSPGRVDQLPVGRLRWRRAGQRTRTGDAGNREGEDEERAPHGQGNGDISGWPTARAGTGRDRR